MLSGAFVHLHVHSKHSLDEGVASVEQLVERAAQLGMRALALTDHNSLAGVVRFHRACEQKRIQPIYGAELDLLPASAVSFGGKTFRHVALAENESGFGNLTALVSLARRREAEGAPPHLTFEELAAKRSGLIVLTGSRQSELFSLLARGDVEALTQHVDWLVGLLGADRLAFEIADFGEPDAARMNAYLVELAAFLRLPAVATNDTRYVLPEDEFARRFLLDAPIQGFIYPRKFLREARTRHLASAEEMLARLPQHPQAVAETARLAARCRFSLMYERRHFPVHDFERGFDAESDLWDRAFQQATRLYGELDERRKDRLNIELDYIRRNSLADFYHLLWRITQHLSEQNITRGTGQGQLLTSLVAYVLGLTEIDPLEYKLQFFGERAGDGGPPVFSIAVPSASFDQVFRYLRETYGANRVARVGRYPASHKGKLFIQLCEWAQLPRTRTHELIAQNILDGRGRQPERLTDLLEHSPNSISPKNPRFLAFLVSRLHPRLRPIAPLEGRVIISGEDLDRVTPREYHPDGEVAQIDADDLSAFGMPQIQLVSNPLLNALDAALHWTRVEGGADVSLARIPLDDRQTFELLDAGATNGVKPFQSATLKTLLRKHRPRTLPQLVKVKLELSPDDERVTDDEFTNIFMDCLLGYRCAYLRTRHPVSYMTAMLNNSFRNRREFAVLWREVARMGIRVFPLDINFARYEFTQEGDAIRAGLMAVQQVGEKVYEEIDRVRRGGEFTDLLDLCRRTDHKLVPRTVIQNLIRAGALDCFGHSRASLDAALPAVLAAARPHAPSEDDAPTLFDETGVRIEALPADPDIPVVEEYSPLRLLQEEKEVAGFVLSQTPLAPYREFLTRCGALVPEQLTAKHEDKHIFLAGHIDHYDTEGPALEGPAVVLLDFEGFAVQVRHPEAERFSPAIYSDDPVLLGGRLKSRDAGASIVMTFCATLRDLLVVNRRTRKIILDLRNEDKRTLKLINATLKSYKGATLVETRAYQGRGGARYLSRIEANKVFWCPPLAYDLQQILPEECISVETDGEG